MRRRLTHGLARLRAAGAAHPRLAGVLEAAAWLAAFVLALAKLPEPPHV